MSKNKEKKSNKFIVTAENINCFSDVSKELKKIKRKIYKIFFNYN